MARRKFPPAGAVGICDYRHGSASIDLQVQVVARRVRQILLHPEIPFHRLNRGVAKRELDLIQLGAAFESQLGKRPPEVVRRDRLGIAGDGA
jgi:hypothetical protein